MSKSASPKFWCPCTNIFFCAPECGDSMNLFWSFWGCFLGNEYLLLLQRISRKFCIIKSLLRGGRAFRWSSVILLALEVEPLSSVLPSKRRSWHFQILPTACAKFRSSLVIFCSHWNIPAGLIPETWFSGKTDLLIFPWTPIFFEGLLTTFHWLQYSIFGIGMCLLGFSWPGEPSAPRFSLPFLLVVFFIC